MTRTKKRLAIILTALIVFLSTVIGVVIIKTTRKTTTVSATSVDSTYANPLPDGAYVAEYTVLDINKGALTGSSAIAAQEAMGNASAVRFKLTATAKNTWATYISLYSTTSYYQGNSNEGSFYFSFRQNSAQNKPISLFILSGDNPVSDIAWNDTTNRCMTFDYPDWLDVSVAGKAYNIEVGGVRVVDASGAMIGTLFYMEVDGARIAEYYYANSGLMFVEDNFNYSANQTAGSLTTTEQSAIDASAATVAFTGESYGVGATPVPAVTLVTEKEGVSYGSVIAPQQYDVAYTDNDKSGTATATVTFKGKYSGTATANFTVVDPFDGYTDPIPNGFSLDNAYTVKEVSPFTYNTAGNSITNALDGADAVRFSLWYGTAATYLNGLTKITLFGNNYYTTDSNTGMINFNIQKSADIGEMGFEIYQTNNVTVKGTKTYTQPVWLDLTTKAQYKFEVGGIDVFDANDAYAGKFFYVDVNGVRIIEYFYNNSDLQFTNDNWSFWSASSATSVTPNNLADTAPIALTDTTKVEIVKSTSGETVEVTPVVYAALTNNGSTYVQRVEDKYYTVTYTDNDKVGTATANISFNGKYAGAASVDFEVVAIALTSDNAATQTVYAMKGATVTLGELSVNGKVFVGYDVSGTLSKTATVVAEENATAKFVAVDFATSTEVSLRKNGSAQNKVGMRFLSTIATADLEMLEAYGATVSFGTMVTSPDKSGKLDIKTVNWLQSEELAVEDCDTFTAVVTGFNSNLYATRFTARAYAEITLSGGETFTVWATVASEYSCSFAKLCHDAISSGEVTETDTYYAYFQEAANAYVEA